MKKIIYLSLLPVLFIGNSKAQTNYKHNINLYIAVSSYNQEIKDYSYNDLLYTFGSNLLYKFNIVKIGAGFDMLFNSNYINNGELYLNNYSYKFYRVKYDDMFFNIYLTSEIFLIGNKKFYFSLPFKLGYTLKSNSLERRYPIYETKSTKALYAGYAPFHRIGLKFNFNFTKRVEMYVGLEYQQNSAFNAISSEELNSREINKINNSNKNHLFIKFGLNSKAYE